MPVEAVATLHHPGPCDTIRDSVIPSGMESTYAIAELDAIRLSDWIDATGLSRSTAYELLNLLKIEPTPKRVPTSRKPVSHLSRQQVEQLNPWAQQLADCCTLPQIRDRLGQSDTVRDGAKQSGIVRDSATQSGIVPAEQMVAMAAAMAAAMPSAPVDPLRRAKALADAAELGVALSSAELADVLGMAAVTVSSWPSGHSPRPGFVLIRCKQKPGSPIWWIVEREGDTTPMKSLSAVGASRTVGFGSCLTVEAVALPYF